MCVERERDSYIRITGNGELREGETIGKRSEREIVCGDVALCVLTRRGTFIAIEESQGSLSF